MGWLPDIPDYRDFTAEHEKIKGIFRSAPLRAASAPGSVDPPPPLLAD